MTDKSRAFGIIAQAVIQNDDISIPARALYALLASYADATSRECRPSNETLCAKMGCSRSTLNRLLAELRDKGIIHRIDRHAEMQSSITRLTDLLAWTGPRTAPALFGTVEEDIPDAGQGPQVGGGSSQTRDEASPTRGTQNSTSKNSTSRTQSRASAAPARWDVRGEASGTDSLSLAQWAAEEFGIKNTEWLQRQVDAFLDWARSAGKKYVDWKAAIRNAVRREVERATPHKPAPNLVSDEPTEDEIREWLRDHLPRVDNPVWTALREAELDGTDEVPRLTEEWRLERRRHAIEALKAER